MPRDEQAIAVGGEDGTAICIVGLPPVAFHFERFGAELWVVRDCIKDLRLNALRVRRSLPVPAKGVLEFGPRRLEVRVRASVVATRAIGQSGHFRSHETDDDPPTLHYLPTQRVQADEQEAASRSAARPTTTPQQPTPASPRTHWEFADSVSLDATQTMGSIPDPEFWGSPCAASFDQPNAQEASKQTFPQEAPTKFSPTVAERFSQQSAGKRSALQNGKTRRRRDPAARPHQVEPQHRLARLGQFIQARPFLSAGISALGAAFIATSLMGVSAMLSNFYEKRPVYLVLEAKTIQGQPISDVRFQVEGQDVGVTQATGKVAALVRGRKNHALQVQADCPGELIDPPPQQVFLRDKVSLSPKSQDSLLVRVVCPAPGPIRHLAKEHRPD